MLKTKVAKFADSISWKVFLAASWLMFTVSLALWWMIFGFRQIDLLERLNHQLQGIELGQQLLRQQKMLLMEGSVLIVCLIFGGLALLYFIYKERASHRLLKEFFATFSHELKTSLASLRLQAESLQEDHHDQGIDSPLVTRLLSDTVRIQMQLENSMNYSALDTSPAYSEEIYSDRLFASMAYLWPQLEIDCKQRFCLQGDIRSVESIFKNLLHNSVLHGRATQVKIEAQKHNQNLVQILVTDNGNGFSGEYRRLGRLFDRPTSKSGNGIGIYIARRMATLMGGDLKVPETSSGFCVAVFLPGELQ